MRKVFLRREVFARFGKSGFYKTENIARNCLHYDQFFCLRHYKRAESTPPQRESLKSEMAGPTVFEGFDFWRARILGDPKLTMNIYAQVEMSDQADAIGRLVPPRSIAALNSPEQRNESVA